MTSHSLCEICYLLGFTRFFICFHQTIFQHNSFEQKPNAFPKLPVHIVQTQRFAFDAVIPPSLNVWTLDSNAVIECILIYSSCYTILVLVMKLLQLAYWSCIYLRLLLHPFMVVTSSPKWTKLHPSYHFSHAQSTLFGKTTSGKSDKNFPQQNFQRSEIY